MKKAQVALIAVTAACFLLIAGIFVGRNLLPNYYMPHYQSDNNSNEPQSGSEVGKININSATKDELMQLPGIGEVIAQRIIDYRQNVAAFETIEDLTNVDGIGDGTLDNIRDFITTGG